jgi:alpha-beta hydrolase superfamily lysophospholipase
MNGGKIHEYQSLIRFRAEDGFLVVGLLVTKRDSRAQEILDGPILLQVHGLLGHFLARGTPRLLPHALLDRGFSSFSINTRLASAGQITGQGVFDDTIMDLDASVSFLIQEGFRRIFVLGYSLGACMVVHWAANRNYPQIKGIILEGPPYSFPDSKKKRYGLYGSSPGYEELYEKAKTVLGNDPYNSGNDETIIVYRSRGPTREPLSDEIFTYKTWWFMEGPEAHAVKSYRHMDKVHLPMLIMRGENDPLVESWEPTELAEIARYAGNKAVRVVQIPGAKHDCMENSEAMVEEIVRILREHA